MRSSTWFAPLLVGIAFVDAASFKVRLNPSNIRATPLDPDFTNVWTIGSTSTTNITIDGVGLGLSVPPSSVFTGSYYKVVYTRFSAYLGERTIGEGISTNGSTAVPITLTIKGLAAGNHTLLTYHNAWDNRPGATDLTILVDGNTAVSSQPQTVRQDNIWNSAHSYINFSVTSTTQEITVVYTPSSTSSGNITDFRAFLNGFEFDGPNIDDQASFPYPYHTEEHIDGDEDGEVQASWTAPKSDSDATYDVYLGTGSPSNLTKVSNDQAATTFTFSNLNKLDKYYWRVDSTIAGVTIPGRVWEFRLRQLSFPDAEGWGRFARGGRGGKIVKVTSLEDYSITDTPIEGTLRYALTKVTGPRTVVFDVGGLITLTSRLSVNDSYITLAGQTAPGKGIAVIGWPLGLTGAADVVVRHMRVRPGKVFNATTDGMGMQGSNHAIFDRNSMGWAMDESFSSRAAYNITFQRNMISEPLNVAGHQNYPPGTPHGFAASISGDVGSFHHNLIAHAAGRSWSMAGGVDNAGFFAGRLDLRNNVVYNFGYRVTDGGVHQANFVGNLYKHGPASNVTFDLRAQYENQLPGTQTYYCAGNSQPGFFSQDSKQVVEATCDTCKGRNTTCDEVGPECGECNVVGACFACITIDPPPSYQLFYDQEFFEPEVETQTSTESYKRVLSDAGAQYPVQDDHDKRIIHETLTNTTTYNGSVTGLPGLIDNPADVGGLEDFPTVSRDASWDADGDGIADWWDGSHGGDDGYTALDGYLNFMADPHVFVQPGNSVTVNLTAFARGFVPPVTYTATAGKGTVSLSGANATYTAPASGVSVDEINFGIKDAEGSTWSRSIGVGIFADA